MTENKPSKLIRSKSGVFQDLAYRIKLILRLMSDKRVSPWLKAIPLGSLAYLIIPDLAPGPLDDAAILWIGLYLFVELCPPEVVEEHMTALNRTIPGEFQEAVDAKVNPGEEVVDAEFREVK